MGHARPPGDENPGVAAILCNPRSSHPALLQDEVYRKLWGHYDPKSRRVQNLEQDCEVCVVPCASFLDLADAHCDPCTRSLCQTVAQRTVAFMPSTSWTLARICTFQL